MKIALDTGPLISGHKVRGIGVHTRELVRALKILRYKDIKIFKVNFSKTDLSKYDIVHYPFFHPYFLTLPSKKAAKRVIVTIHDLIPLIYPKKYPSGVMGKVNFIKQKSRLKYVDAIITISETSKKDICRFLAVHPNKVHVIHLAPRRIFKPITEHKTLTTVQKKYGLPDSFALYVGDVNYNKNIPTLLKACKLAKMKLVVCGKQALDLETMGIGLDVLGGPKDWIRFLLDIPHPEQAHYGKLNDSFRGNKTILRLGFVPDKDLIAIFGLASLYCQPSYYEGFGLPILEAMACGTPVVASKIQAHTEIAENAALFADPNKPEDFVKQFKKVVKNAKVRSNIIKKGFRKTKQYSWEKTAKETLKVYEG